ncbi:hypothetical protein EVG20_g4443 [Dentipellis fragilis]|uniref:Uncharacterized protein n=1 Tax=Dentipellis fragilis TaxID=205917 RepID=A0A4Y9YWR2_9AGAM|nr:hypothetical protein EVG20_g4443 [Dentipellis fragilis]
MKSVIPTVPILQKLSRYSCLRPARQTGQHHSDTIAFGPSFRRRDASQYADVCASYELQPPRARLIISDFNSTHVDMEPYRPYSAARKRRDHSSVQRASTFPSHSNASISVSGPQSSNTSNHEDQVLPSRTQIDRELYEARLALDQGRISEAQYFDVLCDSLAKGAARLDRGRLGLRRAMRDEDSRKQIQREYGLTDKEMEEMRGETRRTINLKLENEQRNEQGRLRRVVTRGL